MCRGGEPLDRLGMSARRIHRFTERDLAGLTTHVLDISRGVPASGVKVDLLELGENGARLLVTLATTNADGRTDKPLIAPKGARGKFELVFHVGEYFRAKGGSSRPPFLDVVPIRFAVADARRTTMCRCSTALELFDLPGELRRPCDGCSRSFCSRRPSAKAALAETRCGWVVNPTPGNWWLNDRDGSWIFC